MEYLYLFFTSFISATFFPLGSEALLIYYLRENYHYILLIFFAGLGNTFGSILNYWFGYKGEIYILEKRLITQKNLSKYKKYFNKYGSYTLLFSWLPVIGDIFTLIAGILKYDIKKFVILVYIAKNLRYIFVVYSFYLFS